VTKKKNKSADAEVYTPFKYNYFEWKRVPAKRADDLRIVSRKSTLIERLNDLSYKGSTDLIVHREKSEDLVTYFPAAQPNIISDLLNILSKKKDGNVFDRSLKFAAKYGHLDLPTKQEVYYLEYIFFAGKIDKIRRSIRRQKLNRKIFDKYFDLNEPGRKIKDTVVTFEMYKHMKASDLVFFARPDILRNETNIEDAKNFVFQLHPKDLRTYILARFFQELSGGHWQYLRCDWCSEWFRNPVTRTNKNACSKSHQKQANNRLNALKRKAK